MITRNTQLTLRKATRFDSGAIENLLEQNWAVHTRLLPVDIRDRLEQDIAFIIEDQVTMRGFLMVESQPPDTGLIVVAALHDNSHNIPFLERLLPAVEQELQKQEFQFLLQIGNASWLTRRLPEFGFKIRDSIITFEWKQQSLLQLPPHPTLQIRPAHLSDLPDLLAFDRLVFGPMWRKPRATFRDAIGRAISFLVGTIDGQVVAYEWCDRFGEHAHLTRLATHPQFQRQGIASQLLHHTLQTLVARNIKTVSLNTQTDNIASQELYRRFGFTSTQQVINVYQKELKRL